MRKALTMLMVIAFVLSIAIVASARAAPTKEKAFTSNAAVETVSPSVVSVQTMTGYDVIQNTTIEPRDLFIANTFDVDTSARMRLSATVDWRSGYSASMSNRNRSQPCIVLRT